MINMVMNQRSFGLADGLLDGVQLLGEVDTRAPLIKHLDYAAKMTLSSSQSFDDFGVGFVKMILCHSQNISPRGGYRNRRACRSSDHLGVSRPGNQIASFQMLTSGERRYSVVASPCKA